MKTFNSVLSLISTLLISICLLTSAQAEQSASPLDAALAQQDDAAKARFKYRNPKETLEFLEIAPGMTVVEALPGGGWYTKILYIRAMHNLNRFNDTGGYLDSALKESYAALKPGGVLGIVQHEGREDRPDEWADGSNGYLKKSNMIAAVEAAGFEFVGESDVNNNEKDQAKEGDFVWRLPPSYSGAGDDEEKRAAVDEIGESNRMTLKFRKPSA